MAPQKPQVTSRSHFQAGTTEQGRKRQTLEVAVNALGNTFPRTADFYLELVELSGTKRAGGFIDRQDLESLGHWLIDQFGTEGGEN